MNKNMEEKFKYLLQRIILPIQAISPPQNITSLLLEIEHTNIEDKPLKEYMIALVNIIHTTPAEDLNKAREGLQFIQKNMKSIVEKYPILDQEIIQKYLQVENEDKSYFSCIIEQYQVFQDEMKLAIKSNSMQEIRRVYEEGQEFSNNGWSILHLGVRRGLSKMISHLEGIKND